MSAYKKGFLPRGVPYSPYYTTQSYETKLLFDLFYYANDYDTFYKVIMPFASYLMAQQKDVCVFKSKISCLLSH